MKTSYLAHNQPPKFASQFLSWALPENLVEPVLGDLSEEYLQRISNNQLIEAKYWYWRQAIKSGMQFILKTQRGFVMSIFSTLLFFGLTLMVMILAGGPSLYIDTLSVLIVFPPAIAFTYASTSTADVKRAFSLLLGNDRSQDEQSYRISRRVFTVLGNLGVVLGVFWTFLGWVALGLNMDDMAQLGPALGYSIITLIYGIALKLLCYVAEQKLQTLSER